MSPKAYTPPFTTEQIEAAKLASELFLPTQYGTDTVLNQVYELEHASVFQWADIGQIPAGYSFFLYGFTIGLANTSGLVVQYNVKIAITDAGNNVIRNIFKMMLPKIGGTYYQECFALPRPYLLYSTEKFRFYTDSSIAVNLLLFGVIRKN